ncbi:MAG: histidine--tRNA ligase [Clostridiales bacterium]|nr:histidine--tRNA ligase [Clostridiales bacterium]
MVNIPKGTKDVLPQDSYRWHYVENVVREVSKLFGVKEIRTPTFEHTELFLRGVGDTTDIVNKEMYTFEDKGKRSITLKPEGTAGVARAFIENGLISSAMPLKMYYITPVFRYERPQAGRLREHHQFGVEFYGAKGADIDAEVILTAYTVLKRLGLSVALNINSMGCKECRKEYNNALKEFYKDKLDGMCPTCRERYEKNPLRIIDCKEENCKKINENAPAITDYLCDECSEHFESLKKHLTIAGLTYTVNPKIVRGLDYYTKTVFEFVTTALGSQGTVCGGGRYDNLIEQIGGSSVPGVGFGMGLERVLMLMDAEGVEIPNKESVKVFLASMGDKANEKAFELCYKLRTEGISAETDHVGRSFKSQFKYADKIGAEYVIALGDNEIESGKCKVKKMLDGSETEIELDEVVSFFKV